VPCGVGEDDEVLEGVGVCAGVEAGTEAAVVDGKPPEALAVVGAATGSDPPHPAQKIRIGAATTDPRCIE